MNRLALGAVVGPVVFAATWFVLGFVSQGYSIWGTWIAPYSAITQPISGLGLGDTAPFMNTAFVLCGLLVAAGSVGIFQGIGELGRAGRWVCTGLMALSGVGAAICGIFDLESFFPHFIGFLLAAGTPVFGFLIIGWQLRRAPRWRRLGGWLFLAGPLTLALMISYFVSFDPTAAGAGHGIAGLVQRVLILEIHAWYVALGWVAFTGTSSHR